MEAEIKENPVHVRRSLHSDIDMSSIVYPEKDPNFVPFGIYKDLLKIFASDVFAPVMIVGDSGNGKSFSVMQAIAQLKLGIISISMDASTTEDDLIGHYGLVDGNTVYEKGPVRIAAELGVPILLDEMDRANPAALICLNMLIDGFTVFDKKTGDNIVPKKGFKLIATANTKGQGDDTDRFITAGVLDEAFLERFPIMLEQGYPTAATEKKILSKLNSNDIFVENLVTWANATRKTYQSGAIENFITTRRLVFIAGKNYQIFGNEDKAVKHAIARFPQTVSDSFTELFEAINSNEYVDPFADEEEEGKKIYGDMTIPI
jgi:hypothetical protein